MTSLFKLIVQEKDPKKLGSFLLTNGFSHQALIKARHHHGMILVNHKRRYLSFHLRTGDEVIFVSAGSTNEFIAQYLTAKNVKDGYIDYETSKEYISENDYEEVMQRGKPEIGDVLITTEAPCGNVAQVNKANIAFAQRIIKYRGH